METFSALLFICERNPPATPNKSPSTMIENFCGNIYAKRILSCVTASRWRFQDCHTKYIANLLHLGHGWKITPHTNDGLVIKKKLMQNKHIIYQLMFTFIGYFQAEMRVHLTEYSRFGKFIYWVEQYDMNTQKRIICIQQTTKKACKYLCGIRQTRLKFLEKHWLECHVNWCIISSL